MCLPNHLQQRGIYNVLPIIYHPHLLIKLADLLTGQMPVAGLLVHGQLDGQGGDHPAPATNVQPQVHLPQSPPEIVVFTFRNSPPYLDILIHPYYNKTTTTQIFRKIKNNLIRIRAQSQQNGEIIRATILETLSNLVDLLNNVEVVEPHKIAFLLQIFSSSTISSLIRLVL